MTLAEYDLFMYLNFVQPLPRQCHELLQLCCSVVVNLHYPFSVVLHGLMFTMFQAANAGQNASQVQAAPPGQLARFSRPLRPRCFISSHWYIEEVGGCACWAGSDEGRALLVGGRAGNRDPVRRWRGVARVGIRSSGKCRAVGHSARMGGPASEYSAEPIGPPPGGPSVFFGQIKCRARV
jgi:hypothetical protein